MNWHIDQYSMCKTAVSFCYGFSSNKLRTASTVFAPGLLEQRPLAKSQDYSDRTFFKDLSMKDIQGIFDENTLDPERLMMQAGLVRRADSFSTAYVWMEAYFDHFESMPNSREIHLDSDKKRRIYQDYVDAQKGAENVLSEGQFSTM
jgi:hypothetical protein